MQLSHEKLKQKRREKGYTLKYVADKLGMSLPNYQKYESGVYKLRADMLPKLSSILDCEIINFFTN